MQDTDKKVNPGWFSTFGHYFQIPKDFQFIPIFLSSASDFG